MKTLFRSQELWDLVENGYEDDDRETKKRDAKALFFIQQALHDTIFSRIAAAETSKEAWMILKNEFQGSSKVITVKLQSLRREFETLFMKDNESVQDFLSRATAIVSQMRLYGEEIFDKTIVAKVLRSLTKKFDHVVAAIEESKDLSVFSFDELMGSLLAHETRLNRSVESNEEKAFQVKGETPFQAERTTGRGRGKSFFRGKDTFHGRSRGRFDGQSEHKKGLWCNYCDRSGHTEDFCRNKGKGFWCTFCNRSGHTNDFCRNKQNQASYAEENEEDNKLFMAYCDVNDDESHVWFVDSGCSNHMSGTRSMSKEIDESQRKNIRLGDNKQIQVEGKGTAAVETNHGQVRLLHNVFFVPSLAHNLLSVG